MNKTEAVMLHLLEYGQINTWEAIKYYGQTRLSDVIYRFRHKRGLNIINERVYFTDRYGTKSHYDNYILEGDKNGDTNREEV